MEEERKEVKMEIPGQDEPVQEETLCRDRDEPGPVERRRCQIKSSDVRRIGTTPGCAGCKCTLQGRSRRRPHTEECRRRFDTELRRTGYPRIIRMDERMAEYVKEHE